MVWGFSSAYTGSQKSPESIASFPRPQPQPAEAQLRILNLAKPLRPSHTPLPSTCGSRGSSRQLRELARYESPFDFLLIIARIQAWEGFVTLHYVVQCKAESENIGLLIRLVIVGSRHTGFGVFPRKAISVDSAVRTEKLSLEVAKLDGQTLV